MSLSTLSIASKLFYRLHFDIAAQMECLTALTISFEVHLFFSASEKTSEQAIATRGCCISITIIDNFIAIILSACYCV